MIRQDGGTRGPEGLGVSSCPAMGHSRCMKAEAWSQARCLTQQMQARYCAAIMVPVSRGGRPTGSRLV